MLARTRVSLRSERVSYIVSIALLALVYFAIHRAFLVKIAEDDRIVGHLNSGMDAQRAGRYDEAIREFQAALKLDPKAAYLHAGLGEALLESGRVPEAISELQEAIRLNADLVSARYALGKAYARQGRFKEAREAWERVLKSSDQYWARAARQCLSELP